MENYEQTTEVTKQVGNASVETQTDTASQQPKKEGLMLSGLGVAKLQTAAKWAYFLSIVYIVSCALLVVCGICMIVFGASLGASAQNYLTAGIAYILCSVVGIFPSLSSLAFSSKAKRACANGDERELQESMAKLSFTYKYIGILTIVYIALFLLAILFGIIGALMAARL